MNDRHHRFKNLVNRLMEFALTGVLRDDFRHEFSHGGRVRATVGTFD